LYRFSFGVGGIGQSGLTLLIISILHYGRCAKLSAGWESALVFAVANERVQSASRTVFSWFLISSGLAGIWCRADSPAIPERWILSVLHLRPLDGVGNGEKVIVSRNGFPVVANLLGALSIPSY
jgi:hypothetical protein